MAHLSLVKSVSHLKEEHKHLDEIDLESVGIAFSRGSLIELCGPATSGKTSVAVSLLAKLTSDGETCAVVDSGNGFDPISASGIALENLLWVRCGGDLEKAFIAADLLVQAKGFGAIWLSLNGLPRQKLRMVPKTYWYRYRTRIKETPTVLLVTAEDPVSSSASQYSFGFSRPNEPEWSGKGRFKLLSSLSVDIQSRKQYYGAARHAKIEADHNG
jgi:hypothetical protein